MQLKELSIPGCFEIVPDSHVDNRGIFVKPFNTKIFTDHGLECDFKEHFYSTSKENVLRGMHFQVPPHSQTKLVYCMSGRVLDVLVDIRSNSPTFGQVESLELTSSKRNLLYICEGIAHGFFCLENDSTMLYFVSNIYSKDHDAGIHWNSLGYGWPVKDPIVSTRDQNLPELMHYTSPFK